MKNSEENTQSTLSSESSDESDSEVSLQTPSSRSFAGQYGRRRARIMRLARKLHKIPVEVTALRDSVDEQVFDQCLRTCKKRLKEDLESIDYEEFAIKKCVSDWKTFLTELKDANSEPEAHTVAVNIFDTHINGLYKDSSGKQKPSFQELLDKLDSLAHPRMARLDEIQGAIVASRSSTETPPSPTNQSASSLHITNKSINSNQSNQNENTPVLKIQDVSPKRSDENQKERMPIVESPRTYVGSIQVSPLQNIQNNDGSDYNSNAAILNTSNIHEEPPSEYNVSTLNGFPATYQMTNQDNFGSQNPRETNPTVIQHSRQVRNVPFNNSDMYETPIFVTYPYQYDQVRLENSKSQMPYVGHQSNHVFHSNTFSRPPQNYFQANEQFLYPPPAHNRNRALQVEENLNTSDHKATDQSAPPRWQQSHKHGDPSPQPYYADFSSLPQRGNYTVGQAYNSPHNENYKTPIPATTPPAQQDDQVFCYKFIQPKIDIPMFDGKNEMEYPAFINLFKATVHNNPSLPSVIKLTILYNHLKEEPKCLIAGLPMTDQYYATALELLNERYGNPNRMRRKIQHELSQIPPASTTLKSLNQTYTLVRATVWKLRTNDLDADHFSIVQSILTKFPTDILSQASMLKPVNDEWTTESLLNTLRDIIRRREEIQELSSEAKTYKRFWSISKHDNEKLNETINFSNNNSDYNPQYSHNNNLRFSRSRSPNPNYFRPRSRSWNSRRQIETKLQQTQNNARTSSHSVERHSSTSPKLENEYAFAVKSEYQAHIEKSQNNEDNKQSKLKPKNFRSRIGSKSPSERPRSATPTKNKRGGKRYEEFVCAFCDENHRHHLCQNYINARVRLARLIELSKCIICLESGHMAKECDMKNIRVCTFCKGKSHHLSLCYKRERSSKPSLNRANSPKQHGNTSPDNPEAKNKVLCIHEDWETETAPYYDVESVSDREFQDSTYSIENLLKTNSDDDTPEPVTSHVYMVNTKDICPVENCLLVAKVEVSNKLNSKSIEVSCVLDSGASRTWVTQQLVETLNLKVTHHGEFKVSTFQNSAIPNQYSQTTSKAFTVKDLRVKLKIRLANKKILVVEATVAPSLCMIGAVKLPKLSKSDLQFIKGTGIETNSLISTINAENICTPQILFGMNCYVTLMYGNIESRISQSVLELPSKKLIIPSLLGYLIVGTADMKQIRDPEVIALSRVTEQQSNPSTVTNEGIEGIMKNKCYKDNIQISQVSDDFQVVPQDSRCLLTDALNSFQDVESLGIKLYDAEDPDKEATEFFLKTVKFVRDPLTQDQRIQVTFPPRSDRGKLPTNQGLAYARFRAIDRKLHENPKRLLQYHKTFKELLDMKVIEMVPDDELEVEWETHILAHHPVYRDNHPTTPQRTVFDCSAQLNAESYALNQCFLRGNPGIADLGQTLIRMRTHKIQIIADISKAFLCLLLEKQNKDLTRFYWYTNLETKQIVLYRFRRLLFGHVSAPSLLASSIKFLIDQKGEKWCQYSRSHWYVDNLITGTETIEDAKELYDEIVIIFQKEASFRVREWQTNSTEVRKYFSNDLIMNTIMTKILGLRWNADEDILSLPTASFKRLKVWTRRTVLSATNSAFDPLGLASPVYLSAKIFLQKLVINDFEWDTPLTANLIEEGRKALNELQEIGQISIPRYIGFAISDCDISLHTFADASQISYSAVTYIRAVNKTSGEVHLNFVISKTRLNPNSRNPLSITRMELLSLLIATRLITYIRQALKMSQIPATTFSDSLAVLWWLRSKKTLGTFVRNRVNEINNCANTENFFIRSQNNMADIATRPGVTVAELKSSDWFSGPDWLKKGKSDWPIEELPDMSTERPEESSQYCKELRKLSKLDKNKSCLNGTETRKCGNAVLVNHTIDKETDDCPWETMTKRHSKLPRLLRATVFIIRFLFAMIWSKCTERVKSYKPRLSNLFVGVRSKGRITALEIRKALLFLIACTQKFHLREVFLKLETCQKHPLIKQLSISVDLEGILRGKSRVTERSNLPQSAKTPIILPKNSPLTALIINHLHNQLNHASAMYVLAEINKSFWLMSPIATIKKVLKKCQICLKVKGAPYRLPVMSSLPANRVRRSICFENVGVDMFGPTQVKVDCDCNKTTKAYVALFTCFASRNVYLDVVTDLSATQFLEVLKRFVSNIGQPVTITSDNAPHFIMTAKVWNTLINEHENSETNEVLDYCANKGIRWTTIPSHFPAAGGVWERIVGVVKNSLRFAKGREIPNLTKFRTFCAEAQAIVNSRPITTVSNDINEIETLRPIDLWLPQIQPGTPRISSDEIADEFLLQETNQTRLLRTYAFSQKLLDRFWAMFYSLYLPFLRNRYQSHHQQGRSTVSTTPQTGTVVIVKDDNAIRGTWKLGRIHKVNQSADGYIRSVRVKLSNRQLIERPIHLLYPLELDIEPEQDNNTENETEKQPDNNQASAPSPDDQTDDEPIARRTRQRLITNRVPVSFLSLMLPYCLYCLMMYFLPMSVADELSDGKVRFFAWNSTTSECQTWDHYLIISSVTLFIIVCIGLTVMKQLTLLHFKIKRLKFSHGETRSVVEIELADRDARLPTKGTSGSSGFDLYALSHIMLPPHEKMIIRTGVRIKSDLTGIIAPRSGIGMQGVIPMTGVIDPDYRGEISVVMFNHTSGYRIIKFHQRFAQIVFQQTPKINLKVVENFESEQTDRSDLGFGSTGDSETDPSHSDRDLPVTITPPISYTEDFKSVEQDPIFIVFHGNVSVGKSSVIASLKRSFPQLEYRAEPVEKWTAYGKDSVNLLKSHYEDMSNQGWKIPLLAAESEFLMKPKNNSNQTPIIICERDLLACRMFLQTNKQEYKPEDFELLTNHSKFLERIQLYKPTVYVRLVAHPDQIYDRLKKRSREGEAVVDIKFLCRLDHHINKMLEESNVPVSEWDNGEYEFPDDLYWATQLVRLFKEYNLNLDNLRQSATPLMQNNTIWVDSETEKTQMETGDTQRDDYSASQASSTPVRRWPRRQVRQRFHSQRSFLSIMFFCYLSLFVDLTSTSKCKKEWIDKVHPSDYEIVHSQLCIDQGIAIYKNKVNDILCWTVITCKSRSNNSTYLSRGYLDGKGECVLYHKKCTCPHLPNDPNYDRPFPYCSHETYLPEPLHGDAAVLEDLKPNYCSLVRDTLCSNKPHYVNAYVILLYDNTTTWVTSLPLSSDDTVKSAYSCLGYGSEISGTSGYCASHSCSSYYTSKICYYNDIPPTYLSTQLGKYPIKAWAPKRLKYYPSKYIEPDTVDWTAKEARLMCTHSGANITLTRPTDMIQVCSGPYCSTLSNPVSQALPIPIDTLLTPYEVTVKIWASGILVKVDGISCPALNYCNLINCYFCIEYISNPTCANSMYIIVSLIILYLILLIAYHLIKVIYITGKNCHMYGVLCVNVYKGVKYCCCKACCKQKPSGQPDLEMNESLLSAQRPHAIGAKNHARQTSHRRVKPRVSNKLTSVMTILCVIFLSRTVNGCTEFSLLTAETKRCTVGSNSIMECAVGQSARITLAPKNQKACILIDTDSHEPLANIEISVLDVKLICTKRILYYTRDVEFMTNYRKRCPNMGSCKSSYCRQVKPNTFLFDLDFESNNLPGISRCGQAASGWANNCFEFSFACIFWRTYARAKTNVVYEVFECTDYNYNIEVMAKFATQNSTRSQMFSLTPGRHHQWNGARFDIIGILDKEISILNNRKFIQNIASGQIIMFKASEEGSPISGSIGSFHCSTRKDAAIMSKTGCFFDKSVCSCVPADFMVNCVCNQHRLNHLYQEKSIILPIKSDGYVITQESSNIIVNLLQFTTAEMQLDMVNVRFSAKTHKSKCKVYPVSLKGCYGGCISGASFTYACKTDFGQAVAYVQCGDETQFAIECPSLDNSTNITLRLQHAEIHQICTVTCPAGITTFIMTGQLYFVPFTSISNNSQGNSNIIHTGAREDGLNLSMGNVDFGFLYKIFGSHWMLSFLIIAAALILLFITVPCIYPLLLKMSQLFSIIIRKYKKIKCSKLKRRFLRKLKVLKGRAGNLKLRRR